MSILQAVRAEALGLPHDSALSWGLNRAIFFAAAKRGFKGGGGKAGGEVRRKVAGEKTTAEERESEGQYTLGDELAFTSKDHDKLLFTIGGKTQTPEDFQRQVQSRFHSELLFKKAWNEAVKIVKTYDEATLKSGIEFFQEVYKPRRDLLSEKWNEMVSSAPSQA
jgi:hypothetical protein